MTIRDLVLRMSKRMPWTVGSAVLYSLKLPRSQGWDKTLDAYAEPPEKLRKREKELLGALAGHALAGEKLVRLYEVGSADMQALRRAVEQLRKSGGVGDTASAVGKDLKLTDHPQLIAIDLVDGGTALVYGSIRTIAEQQPIDEDVVEDSISERPDVEGFLMIVRRPFDALDVVFVPDEGGHVELRVDYPLGSKRETAELAVPSIEAMFAEDTKVMALGQPRNLFPLVDSMYHDASEGSVVELHFNTPSGSSYSGSARRRSVNLRDDPYHSAGVKGLVAPIEPYSVTIRWPLPIDDKRNRLPELTLHGRAGDEDTAAPLLHDAIVRRCTGLQDFDYVRDRLYAHLLHLAF